MVLAAPEFAALRQARLKRPRLPQARWDLRAGFGARLVPLAAALFAVQDEQAARWSGQTVHQVDQMATR